MYTNNLGSLQDMQQHKQELIVILSKSLNFFNCSLNRSTCIRAFGICLVNRSSSFVKVARIHTEAVVRRYSVKKLLFEILQCSEENTCARAFLKKIAGLYQKRGSGLSVFL